MNKAARALWMMWVITCIDMSTQGWNWSCHTPGKACHSTTHHHHGSGCAIWEGGARRTEACHAVCLPTPSTGRSTAPKLGWMCDGCAGGWCT